MNMANAQTLSGVYAAAVTPIHSDGSPDLEGIETLLEFLAKRGCHGVLILGTTGEGPSFSPLERARFSKPRLRHASFIHYYVCLPAPVLPALTKQST